MSSSGRLSRITLQRVSYMPRELDPGILYVSDKYQVAGHLCACGCGNKVMTPLGPAEWSFTERDGSASIWPSIGNWQLPCRSHYVIRGGRIDWAGDMSQAAVLRGREAEERRRKAYYESRQPKLGFWATLWAKVRKLFGW